MQFACAKKFAAGVMTAAQLAEHTALRRGAACGKLPRPFDRGPLAADPWATGPPCPLARRDRREEPVKRIASSGLWSPGSSGGPSPDPASAVHLVHGIATLFSRAASALSQIASGI